MKHNFGEQEYELAFGKKCPVKILPKYKQTKEKVIALIESPEYKSILSDSDFWILKNFNKDKTECYYSGLIITHEALVRVNDSLKEDQRFNQNFCSDPIVSEWDGVTVLRMDYRDKRDGMYEIGEISLKNCKNDYPYAMLLKRTFDRVVKRKAKLSMVYSDSEAEEFRNVEEKKDPTATEDQVEKIVAYKDVVMDELMERGIKSTKAVANLSIKEASKLCQMIEDRLNGQG